MLTLQSTLKMNDGHELPRLGLGVYRSAPGRETRQAVLWAFEAGYRHVDTARLYRNERDVGEALRASGLGRDEVFITSKLWNADQGYDSAIRACRASLFDLGLDQVDLYLIHWPLEQKRLDSWRALVQLQRDGLCRSIGVSNYTMRHLEDLLDRSPVVPAVNQVEMSPFLSQVELRRFCDRLGIVVEAYSPLTRGRRLGEPTVLEIARAHGKSAAQVLIRWALQREVVVIPKSVHKSRIEENADVFDFELTDEDLRWLDGLDQGLHTAWDPATAP